MFDISVNLNPKRNSKILLTSNQDYNHYFHWADSVIESPITMSVCGVKTVFRCLSPFKIGIHISLEQSIWAELSWNPFWKRIASIVFGPNHSGKKFWGKIWIFEKVIFNFSAETWSNAAVTLHFEDLAV